LKKFSQERDISPNVAQRDLSPAVAQRDLSPTVAQRDLFPTLALRDLSPIQTQGGLFQLYLKEIFSICSSKRSFSYFNSK
jgi:hypothetical protein